MIRAAAAIAAALVLAAGHCSAAEITVIIPANIETATVGSETLQASPYSVNPDVIRDNLALQIEPPPVRYLAELDDRVQLGIVAGSDYRFTLQLRIGETPSPFDPLYPPRAELRTAKSPAGSVLATYAVTIDDQANAIWSQRLTAAQTAALAGASGITEISLADAGGIYGVHYWLPTRVVTHITE